MQRMTETPAASELNASDIIAGPSTPGSGFRMAILP